MYAPANQIPDFHYKVNDSRQKLTAWVGFCGKDDMLSPFLFDRNANGKNYLRLLNEKVLYLMTVLFQIQFHQN